MELNNIQLPEGLLADLYRSSLVETAENVPAISTVAEETDAASVSEWQCLGNNQKNILIVVHYPDAMYLPDAALTFLTTMLGACKLGLNDVALVNIKNYPDASYKEMNSFFKSKIVLLFDIEPASFGLPINFPAYQLQAFANATFLFSPSLTELENDKLQKSKLWVCLKRLFNL